MDCFITVFFCILQSEGSPSLVGLRARSRDSPSPSEELLSPLTRGKRPATRSRGQGDGSGNDSVHSPKRLCFTSVGGPVRTNVIVLKCCLAVKGVRDYFGSHFNV